MSLSPLEESVANLMQFEKTLAPKGSVFGHDNAQEFILEFEDAREPEQALDSEAVLMQEEPCSSNHLDMQNENGRPEASAAGKKKKSQIKASKSERQLLLESHDKMQEKVLNEISKTLTSIKNALKDQKKIEEEKLKLMKRKHEREEELFQTEIKKKSYHC